MALKAVLFDFGQTLFHFPPVDLLEKFGEGAAQVHAYLESIGQHPIGLAGFRARYLRAVQWARLFSIFTRRDFDARQVMDRTFRADDINLTPEQLTHAAWLWYEPLWGTSTVEPDAHRVAETLAGCGLRLGIVSNTIISAATLDEQLRLVGLLEYFSVRVYSCQTAVRKPDRRIFLTALSQIGCRPDQAMFVGDDPKADVLGAQRAGMISVYKSPVPAPKRIHPHHWIRRLAELPPIVAAMARAESRP